MSYFAKKKKNQNYRNLHKKIVSIRENKYLIIIKQI